MSERGWKLAAVATWATAGLAWSVVAWAVHAIRRPHPAARYPHLAQPPRATVSTPFPRSLPS